MKNRIEVFTPLAAGRSPARLADKTNRQRVALEGSDVVKPGTMAHAARQIETENLKATTRKQAAEIEQLRAVLNQTSAESAANLHGAELAAFYEKSGPTVREQLRKTRYADLIAATNLCPKSVKAWNRR